MKLSKITAAIAATVVAASAQAETISGGGLDGVTTDGAAAAVSAIAVVGSTQLLDGLRVMQGFPAGCAGNLTKLCAPSLSSAELRALLVDDIVNTAFVAGGGTTLGAASGLSGKSGGITDHAAIGVVDALKAFAGSGVIGGFSCGQGKFISVTSAANDAATLAAVAAGGNIGYVHATELDGSVGFIKIDGVAPDALNLISSNYNVVSNLSSDNGVVDVAVNGTTVGVVTAGSGVASHAPGACSPLIPGGSIADANGGAL